jgi:tRNA pseudouridine38-40 synthase
MPRYALKIEYDGAPFVGWQRQQSQVSVQGSIEKALSNLENKEHAITGAGRTDAGVHAKCQVAHCDLEKDWEPFRLSEALNFHLRPLPIAVIDCALVDKDWHARFSALERQYLFRILVRRAPSTHEAGLVWQIGHSLDLSKMIEASKYLLGKHDFTTFRSSICQAKSPIKTLDEIKIDRIKSWSGDEFRFQLRARSFLHNQVRSFVGTLERVGAGSWDPVDVKKALEAKDRSACGPVSPPHGLYLTDVMYEPNPFT